MRDKTFNVTPSSRRLISPPPAGVRVHSAGGCASSLRRRACEFTPPAGERVHSGIGCASSPPPAGVRAIPASDERGDLRPRVLRVHLRYCCEPTSAAGERVPPPPSGVRVHLRRRVCESIPGSGVRVHSGIRRARPLRRRVPRNFRSRSPACCVSFARLPSRLGKLQQRRQSKWT